MNLQEKLDKLQPYLLSIRYLDGIPLLDVVLKEEWIIPDENDINKIKGNDKSLNYYMVFSENKVKSLDDLLDYVDRVIKLNQEREQKNQLLRIKIIELKEFFKRHSLNQLNKLKFTLDEFDEFDTYDTFTAKIESVPEPKVPLKLEPVPEPIVPINLGPTLDDVPFTVDFDESGTEPITALPIYLDDKGNPIELSDEEREILEEEARGLKNIQIMKTKKLSNTKPNTKPRIIINQNERDY